MKKRWMGFILTGITAAGMLIGCGGNEAGSQAATEANTKGAGSETAGTGEGAKTGDGPSLTAMCVGSASDAYRETYQEIADDFSRDNEWGATVNIEFYENEQYKTKLTTLMASNSVPDIFFTWELDYLKPFVEGGKVASLQDAIDGDAKWKDSFADGVLDPVTYDGKLYAVPTQKSFCVMFYNKKIFEENKVSVPTTYEEFLNVCETLKNNQVTPMILAATDSWIPAQFVQQISNGIAGMELYDGICKGTRKWNDPAHVEASKEVQSMIDKGYFQDGMLGMTAEEVQSQFKQGKAAMYFQGAWDASTILDKNTSAITDCVGAFTLPAKNPEYNNISVGSVDTCFAVAESSPNKEIATAFLKFWTSKQSEEKLLYEMGRLPSLKVEVDDSKIDPLVAEIIGLSNEAKGLTPWWDRAFGAGEGVEFNNQCLAVFGGSDPQKAFDELQSFAEENADRYKYEICQVPGFTFCKAGQQTGSSNQTGARRSFLMEKIFGNKKSIAVFVLPAFLIYAVFSLIPIFYNIYISLFQTDLMSPGKFVGFKNYINLFKDSTFLTSLRNNIFMVIGSLIAHLPLALLFGNILFTKIKGSHFFQTIFFLPSVICGVAVGLMWSFIYNSEFGLLNKLLELLGFGNARQAWLSNPEIALFCIIIVVMWQFVGYHMIIQIAAMKNIPSSLYEAAEIDGANKWVQFRSITFPLIKNILKVDAVLIITGSLKYYDLVAVMTGGGPNHATELMSTYMFYQGFRTLKYGYSAAIGVILLILCICAVAFSNLIFKSEPVEY